jgi:hypothetical protein
MRGRAITSAELRLRNVLTNRINLADGEVTVFLWAGEREFEYMGGGKWSRKARPVAWIQLTVRIGSGKGYLYLRTGERMLDESADKEYQEADEKRRWGVFADVQMASGGICTPVDIFPNDDMALEALRTMNEKRRLEALEDLGLKPIHQS